MTGTSQYWYSKLVVKHGDGSTGVDRGAAGTGHEPSVVSGAAQRASAAIRESKLCAWASGHVVRTGRPGAPTWSVPSSRGRSTSHHSPHPPRPAMLAASAPSSPPCDQHNNSKQVNLRRTSRRLQRSCRPSPIRHIHVGAMTKATPQPSSKSVTPQARRRCERTARGGAAPHRRWDPTPAPFVRTQSPPRPSAAALPPAAAVGVAARQRGLVVDGRGARGSRRCLQRPAHMVHHLWLRH